MYDHLTGLPNRTLLSERAERAIREAQADNTPLAVIFLDLDHFKKINDSLGHRVGDALLQAMAQRLAAMVREQDTVSRLSGDEFILVLPDTDALGAAHLAEKLLQARWARQATKGWGLDIRAASRAVVAAFIRRLYPHVY